VEQGSTLVVGRSGWILLLVQGVIAALLKRPQPGRNEEDIIMDNYFPETRTTDQQVKDAVYCWVLVNHPEVIEDARELVAA